VHDITPCPLLAFLRLRNSRKSRKHWKGKKSFFIFFFFLCFFFFYTSKVCTYRVPRLFLSAQGNLTRVPLPLFRPRSPHSTPSAGQTTSPFRCNAGNHLCLSSAATPRAVVSVIAGPACGWQPPFKRERCLLWVRWSSFRSAAIDPPPIATWCQAVLPSASRFLLLLLFHHPGPASAHDYEASAATSAFLSSSSLLQPPFPTSLTIT
jgi:hypothetical protein